MWTASLRAAFLATLLLGLIPTPASAKPEDIEFINDDLDKPYRYVDRRYGNAKADRSMQMLVKIFLTKMPANCNLTFGSKNRGREFTTFSIVGQGQVKLKIDEEEKIVDTARIYYQLDKTPYFTISTAVPHTLHFIFFYQDTMLSVDGTYMNMIDHGFGEYWNNYATVYFTDVWGELERKFCDSAEYKIIHFGMEYLDEIDVESKLHGGNFVPIGDVKPGDMVYASGLVDPDRVDIKRWISDHEKKATQHDKDAKLNHICDSWFFRPSPFSRFEDRAGVLGIRDCGHIGGKYMFFAEGEEGDLETKANEALAPSFHGRQLTLPVGVQINVNSLSITQGERVAFTGKRDSNLDKFLKYGSEPTIYFWQRWGHRYMSWLTPTLLRVAVQTTEPRGNRTAAWHLDRRPITWTSQEIEYDRAAATPPKSKKKKTG